MPVVVVVVRLSIAADVYVEVGLGICVAAAVIARSPTAEAANRNLRIIIKFSLLNCGNNQAEDVGSGCLNIFRIG